MMRSLLVLKILLKVFSGWLEDSYRGKHFSKYSKTLIFLICMISQRGTSHYNLGPPSMVLKCISLKIWSLKVWGSVFLSLEILPQPRKFLNFQVSQIWCHSAEMNAVRLMVELRHSFDSLFRINSSLWG